jgi:hypothetical protein
MWLLNDHIHCYDNKKKRVYEIFFNRNFVVQTDSYLKIKSAKQICLNL